jgi:hypothetical protein
MTQKRAKRWGKSVLQRFYDLLEEVLERYRVVRVLDMDELSELGREAVAEEACKLVVPAFRRFMQRMKDREFSKSKCVVRPVVPNSLLTSPSFRSSKMYVLLRPRKYPSYMLIYSYTRYQNVAGQGRITTK